MVHDLWAVDNYSPHHVLQPEGLSKAIFTLYDLFKMRVIRRAGWWNVAERIANKVIDSYKYSPFSFCIFLFSLYSVYISIYIANIIYLPFGRHSCAENTKRRGAEFRKMSVQ
jgi:hypothetical protein